MKIFSVAALCALFLLCNTAVTYSQHTRTKTLKVNKNGNLLVDITFGDIVIKTWDRNEVRVKYDLEDYEDDETFSIKATGNHVRIRSYSGSSGEVEVEIPAQYNVEMKTAAGDLSLNGHIYGSISGSTSGGDIRISKVNGSVELMTYGGDIHAEELKGDIRILTNGGDLNLNNIEGTGSISTQGGNINLNNVSKSITIKTAGGNINVSSLNGKTKVNTGGGDITINSINGSTELKTGGGNIRGGNGKAFIEASTSNGNITFQRVDGSVKANTGSGDISVELLNDNSESYLRTSYGNIRLYIRPDAKLTVEVKVKGVSYGSDENDYVRTEINPTKRNIVKENDGITLTYTFNGGGKKIYLGTGYGEVEIKRSR